MPDTILQLTANIVSKQIAKTPTDAVKLTELIRLVHAALSNAERPIDVVEAKEPAVPIKKSVFPDFIICLEDGKKLKMLKRHLKTAFSMTPSEYRAKWKLPDDYPMVAPSYASHRSMLAKSIGLGRKASAPIGEPIVQKMPARKARGSKG